MYLLIIGLPFLGSFFSGFRGNYLGKKGSIYVSTLSIFLSTVISITIFFEVGLSRSPVIVRIGNWINSEFLNVDFSFYFDDLTISILVVVLSVSFLVHVYSIAYISSDPHVQRFISYLSFFTAGIVLLVTGDSILVIFIGWELIGVASFLLIGF